MAAPRKKAAAKKAAAKKPVVEPDPVAPVLSLDAVLGRSSSEEPDEFLRRMMQELATRIIDDFHQMLDEASPQIKQRMLQSAFTQMLRMAFESGPAKDDSVHAMREAMMGMFKDITTGGSDGEEVA